METLKTRGLPANGGYTDHWNVQWRGVGTTRGQVKSPPLAKPSPKGYRFPERLPEEILTHMQSRAAKSQDLFRVCKVGEL